MNVVAIAVVVVITPIIMTNSKDSMSCMNTITAATIVAMTRTATIVVSIEANHCCYCYSLMK